MTSRRPSTLDRVILGPHDNCVIMRALFLDSCVPANDVMQLST